MNTPITLGAAICFFLALAIMAFAQDAADEREAFQMVARHESEIVDFWIDQEAIAPARMLGR